MPPQSLYDWRAFTAALEETTPWWEPGTRHGYHAMAFGYLVGEVIRRVSGRTVGQFLREEVTTPLGADFFLGVPAAEHARLADIVPEPLRLGGGTTFWETILREPQSMVARAFFNPWRTITSMNTRAWRAAEIPAANGHTTARALARIYGALAQGGTLDGVRLLHPATIDAAIVEQSSGPDAVLSCQTRFGLGFMLTKPEQTSACALGIPRVGPNARAFGHPGFGGSIGFADPDVRLGFGYVTNFYRTGTRQDPDLRRECLIKAAYASLGVR
jgi:CubicO group peptidase (beta-lactamase class C family)